MEKAENIYKEYSEPYPLVIHWSQYLLLRDLHLAFLVSDESIKNVLDVGAGTGYQTIELLKAGKTVTAIDMSEEMLGKLEQSVAEEASALNNRLTVLNMDGQQLDFKDESFDAVTGMNAYYNFPDPLKGFRESYRVLKKGGPFLASGPKEGGDIDALHLSFAADLLIDGILGGGVAKPHVLKDIMDEKYDGPNAHHLKAIREANKELMKIATFYDSESLSDLLINEIGFSKVLFKSDNPYNKQAYFVAVRK